MEWIKIKEGDNILKIDAPCGRITSFATIEKGVLKSVKFNCVPSFVVGLDKKVDVPRLGTITYDLAYGGAFYAYVDMNKNDFDFDLSTNSYQKLINNGMAIKRAVMEKNTDIAHPFEADLGFLYKTLCLLNPASFIQSSITFIGITQL